ncbi:Cytochrome C biogenesis protein [Candidatus Desulfarcum epimagneticum]|uniref:Cytochrome C biogenesis protein n=1 Tax=uncultured Desulfobacteraceae bacterium TaxID=218296 RepID=A0A484HL86_9BACT|nr:Cytochrome C biogenesis protein [uncultured Desulfobacteraceae bacterium]
MFIETISYPAAFLAGLLSFFSPCILPLIPAYFVFITGVSFNDMTAGPDSSMKRRALVSSLWYILGFSTVFIALGASASWIGNMAGPYKEHLRVAGGIVIILFGLHLSGLFRISGLDVEKKLHARKKPLHFAGIFLVGMLFAAGWSPCIGPILGSILIVAGSRESVWQGVLLLSFYSAGLALPFIGASFFIHLIATLIKKVSPSLKYLNAAAGILLALIGTLILLDKFYLI